MTRDELLQNIQEIFRDVFDDEDLIIQETTNASDIDDWDSINHINLVSIIEGEYGVRFALGELTTLKNVGDMIDLLIQKKN